MSKICITCKIEKEDDEFLKDKRSSDGLFSSCKSCSNSRRNLNRVVRGGGTFAEKEWRIKNRDKIKLKASTWYSNIRNEFLIMYGNKCSCCEETHSEFLTIEHKNGQKGKKRDASHKAYRDAIKEYRPDLYEILCMNCNHARGRYGYCPHHT